MEKIKRMTPAKIAPLAVYLLSDQANEVSGQIFAVRMNEIFLMSQPRPIRSVHRAEGWTPEAIAEHAITRRALSLLSSRAFRRRLQLGPGLGRHSEKVEVERRFLKL